MVKALTFSPPELSSVAIPISQKRTLRPREDVTWGLKHTGDGVLPLPATLSLGTVPQVWTLAPARYPPPPRRASYPGVDDQVGADVHLFEVRVPLLPVPVLHLVRLVQVLQRRLCDVHPARGDQSQTAAGPPERVGGTCPGGAQQTGPSRLEPRRAPPNSGSRSPSLSPGCPSHISPQSAP